MGEVTMSQSANISVLLFSLSDKCPSMKVTIQNLGAVKITGDKVQFLSEPTRTTVDLQSIKLPEPIVEPGTLEAKKFYGQMKSCNCSLAGFIRNRRKRLAKGEK